MTKADLVRLERNYFFGIRDGLEQSLYLSKSEIFKRMKAWNKEADKLTKLYVKYSKETK